MEPFYELRLRLGVDPDLNRLPFRATADELRQLHERWFGAITARAIRDWPLMWVRHNGELVAETAAFLVEARRRFDTRPIPPMPIPLSQLSGEGGTQ